MPYDVGDDPYVSTTTGVLKNLLSIHRQEDLDAAEAELSSVQMSTLIIEDKPRAESFDWQMLCDVHAYIFGDIYDWAGKPRLIELSKDGTSFARAAHIEQSAHAVFTALAKESYLAGLEQAAFVRRLAYYYGELNVLHPFREGNGWAIRTLLYMLAESVGWFVDWNKMDALENISASVASYNSDENPLQMMLAKFIVPIV